MKQKTDKRWWEDAFDKKFKDSALIYPKAYVESAMKYRFSTKLEMDGFKSVGLDDIKFFISQVEQQTLQEIKRKVEGKVVHKMIDWRWSEFHQSDTDNALNGYNQALSDILNLLKEI